jgi:L-alanine-DL-glutamate epimerase-like enolase superfamily enzyme
VTPGHLEGLTIERIDTFAVRLPSLRSFSLAGGAVTLAGAPAIRVLVKVTGSDGSTGSGEATPIPSWTYETLESITTTIEGYLAPAVRGQAYTLDAAIRQARRLAELDVAAFEQPLPANDIAGLRRCARSHRFRWRSMRASAIPPTWPPS